MYGRNSNEGEECVERKGKEGEERREEGGDSCLSKRLSVGWIAPNGKMIVFPSLHTFQTN
jgi:hypothetical protein